MNLKMKRTFTMLGAAMCMTAAAGMLGAASPQDGMMAKKQNKKKSTMTQLEIGEKVPAFTLTGIDGKEYSLKDFAGKNLVIEWTNPGCPYVVGAYRAGVVKNTVDKMKAMGDNYAYIAINSTARNMEKEDVIKQNTKFLKEYNLEFPVLIDYDGTVGKAFGAKHTPDLYVVDGEGVLRYQGGFTDDSRFSKGDEAMNYVVNALTMMKDGETVAPDRAKRWGCSVKYAKN